MADQGPSIIPPFTKPVWPIRDQALLRSDESLQQPYLPHVNGDLKHARKRPTISHLFSFLCSHSNLTPMPVMSKLWWSERRVTNSSSCNSVALRSMAFCKRLHKCSCLERCISSLGFVHILGLELPELLLRDHALFCPSRDRKRQRPTKLHF